MKEIAEFRVLERHAHLLFAPHEGQRLGDWIRRIEIRTDDPRFPRIRELQEQLNAQGDSFFLGWDLRRSYTRKELAVATRFQVIPSASFEPAGEDCGTRYTLGCKWCGGGATPIGPLILGRRFPKKDFANTITDELVASRLAVDAFRAARITGVSFEPVYHGSPLVASKDRFQIIVRSDDANVVFPTRAGGSIFNPDDESKYRCIEGHLLGLNIHSEAYVDRRSVCEYDIVASRQFVGPKNTIGGGFARPRRLLFASRRVYDVVRAAGLKGWTFEIAREIEYSADDRQ